MNRKISVGMTVTIVILAMTVTFSITMLLAMRLFDHTVTSVKEKESMYNKVAEVDRYVRANDYYDIDETVLYDRLTAGYLLGTGDKYARYYTASAYADLLNAQSGKLMGIGVELAIDQSGYAKVIKVYDESGQRGGYPEQTPGRERHERQCGLAGQRERPAHRRPDPLRLYGQQRRFRAGAGQCGLHQNLAVRQLHPQ